MLIKVDAIRDQWFILFTPIYNMVGCEKGPFPFVFQGGELARFFLCASVVIAPHLLLREWKQVTHCFHSKQWSDLSPLGHYAEGGIRAIRAI